MRGGHTGEDIAKAILHVLKEYGIINNLGVFIVDNAKSNDTAVKAILRELKPIIQDISP
jgi:hypothetical protein